ncbi:MAG TPA: SDR family NAD(P)-dependent oxidoreductase [archaeon]|nr:SDR family NAD(P)-dependent oxidoreductase [archaeon]
MKMDWSNKTVLVTGAAGFLGSHLTDALANAGARVKIIDILSQISTRNIDHLKEKIEFVDVDITNENDLNKVDGDADYIFHLAAYAVPALCEQNPYLAFKTNVQGTFNMLRFGVRKDIEKFIFPSSALLYGRYPQYLPIDEKHPIEGTSNIYNATKKIGEDLCLTFHEKHNLPVIFFRLFNAFGPRQAVDYFIPTTIVQAMKTKMVELWNEKPTRDFTFVTDTVDALMKAAESKFLGGPINVGSGREVRTGDIARQIANSFDAKIKFLNKEVTGSMRLQCDNTKAREILRWHPTVPFEDGLEKTIQWFKDHSDSY